MRQKENSKKPRILTTRNWSHYYKTSSALAMLAYLECSEDMVNELLNIQDNSKSLRQLKENLSAFISDRQNFNNHVSKKWKPDYRKFYTQNDIQ